MDPKPLPELEKILITLFREPDNRENRNAMREVVRDLYKRLEEAKTVKEYCQVEDLFDTANGMLRHKYHEMMTMKYVHLPREES